MTEYAIEFDDRALREWDELDGSIRRKFEKKLEKLVLNPHSPGNELHGDLAGFYKDQTAPGRLPPRLSGRGTADRHLRHRGRTP